MQAKLNSSDIKSFPIVEMVVLRAVQLSQSDMICKVILEVTQDERPIMVTGGFNIIIKQSILDKSEQVKAMFRTGSIEHPLFFGVGAIVHYTGRYTVLNINVKKVHNQLPSDRWRLTFIRSAVDVFFPNKNVCWTKFYGKKGDIEMVRLDGSKQKPFPSYIRKRIQTLNAIK